MTHSPFDRRLAWLLGAVAFLLFAWALQGSLRASGEGREPDAADAYGRGPLGYRGLADSLRRLEIPVRISRRPPHELAGADELVIMALPVLNGEQTRALRTTLAAEGLGRVLLVLPKWRLLPWNELMFEVPGTDRVTIVPVADIETMARGLGLPLRLVRPAGSQVFTCVDAAGDEARANLVLEGPQLIGSDDAFERGRCDAPAGLLHSRVRQGIFGETEVSVLSDPDLLANHGLVQGENARAAFEILRSTGGLQEGVVFEETIHGHTTPPLWATLLQAPLVYATAHLVLLALLWFLAGARRFGAPEPDPPALRRGRQTLLENTALLLHRGGHAAYALKRYWQATLRDLAGHLRVPGESHGARVEALVRAAPPGHDPKALDADVAAAAQRKLDPRAIARLARKIHRLRLSLTHDPRGETR